MRLTLTIATALAIIATSLSLTDARLIGFNCEGYNTPLIATEEDQLPQCERIERLPFTQGR
jgi:hypothetical protein